MPITYTSSNIFDSTADALVVPVNTAGVMGAGLAKQFATRWPDLLAEYGSACARGVLKIGSLFFWQVNDPRHAKLITTPRYVVCFPTKRHWRYPSKLEYIETGLGLFTQHYGTFDITTAAFPKLGCGLGQLNWDRDVEPLMERYLNPLPLSVSIHLFP